MLQLDDVHLESSMYVPVCIFGVVDAKNTMQDEVSTALTASPPKKPSEKTSQTADHEATKGFLVHQTSGGGWGGLEVRVAILPSRVKVQRRRRMSGPSCWVILDQWQQEV